MKRILLFSFLCTFYVHVIGQAITGNIIFPVTDTICIDEVLCCSYPPLTTPVSNVLLNAKNLITNVTDQAYSNQLGDFTVNVGGGTVQITPTINDPNWLNGVSTFDLIRLQQYLINSIQIQCPFRRIAADVDFDGDIDATDKSIIQDLILGRISSFTEVPNWRSIPKNIIELYDLNPSKGAMSTFFWETENSSPGFVIPFIAIHGLDNPPPNQGFNIQAFYKGNSQLFSFMDDLRYWPNQYGNGDNCGPIEYGFYVFKAGDITGNANPNFSSGQRTINQDLNIIVNRTSNNLSLRSNGKVNIIISAKYDSPIAGWQLGAQFDSSSFEEINLDKEKKNEKLSLEKNFGFKNKGEKNSELRTLWFAENSKEYLDLSRGEELFNLELKIKKNIGEVNLDNIFKITSQVLNAEFIDKNGNDVTEKVEILVTIQ